MDDELIRVVCVAGRQGWDGVTEVMMAYPEIVERKAVRFLEQLAVAGFTIVRIDND